MPAIVSDVVSDAVAVVQKLRADDRLITDPNQALNEFETVRDLITLLEAELAHRLREIHRSEACNDACGRSTKGWLREELMLAGVEVSRLMRLVHKLRCFPLTEAAFDAAQITIAHVAAIITALETLPQHLWVTLEPHLVEHARFAPPEEIAAFIDELLQALGIDRASEIRRERRYAQRGIDLHKTLHGTRSITGTLTPDVGDTVDKALALAAKASGDGDDRTPRQRAHDALGAIAAAYLGSHGTPSFNGAPRTVIITIDLETLHNQLIDRWITLPDGMTLSAATARRLACDAELIPVVLGSASEILDIGAANHEFSTAQRRAAYLQQAGQCAFPGCRGVLAELHHITFRRHGGPGVLTNAAWLCGYHHWLVHEGRWTLRRQPDDRSFLWTGPNGQQRIRHLTPARHLQTA